MLEIIVLLVYLSHLVALAHSRGRSWAWALGGLAVWLLADATAWALFPHDRLMAAALGVPTALVLAMAYRRLVHELPPVEQATSYGRGNNFPCPCCASLQTEDLAGHLACNACGSAFGRA